MYDRYIIPGILRCIIIQVYYNIPGVYYNNIIIITFSKSFTVYADYAKR